MKLNYININNDPISIILPADEILLYEISKVKKGTVSYNLEILNPSIDFDGIKVSQYKEELYNNIHLINKDNDVGFIAQDTEIDLEVWNSYYTTKTISDYTVSNNNEIELYTPKSLPINILSNQSEVFTLKIFSDGNSSIDASFNFEFLDQNVSGSVSGLRALLFDFDHNWISSFTENYSFYTAIIKSVANYEQRFTYGEDNVYTCKYFYSLKNEEKQKLDLILYNNVNKLISLPLYVYTLKTTESEFVGSTKFKVSSLENTIFQNNLQLYVKYKDIIEIVDIESVNLLTNEINLKKPLKNGFLTGSYLIPVITCTTVDVSKNNINTNYANYEITFKKELDGIDILTTNKEYNFQKLNDINILTVNPNENLDINYEYNSNIITLSNDFGFEEKITYNDLNEISFSFNYVMNKKDQISYMKNLFNDQKGMYKDLHYINFSDDIIILDNIFESDTIIKIKNINAVNFIKDKKIRYINIKYGNNNKIVEFININRVDNNVEEIVLSENFGINLLKNNINYSGFILTGRLNNDLLSLNYRTDGIVDTTINFIKNIDIE